MKSVETSAIVWHFDRVHSGAAHITGRVRGGYYQGEGPASQEILDTVTNTDNDDVLSKIELTKVPLTDHTHTMYSCLLS